MSRGSTRDSKQRADARLPYRLLPRFGVAAGGDPSASGDRGAVCLGIPDTAVFGGRRAVDGIDDGVKVDSADLHAWAEAFLPGAGWIGMDPTSGLFAGEGHIPLVCTPNAAKAAPIGGTVEPAHVEFDFSMSVRRINATPSLSKPFSDEEWEAGAGRCSCGRRRA